MRDDLLTGLELYIEYTDMVIFHDQFVNIPGNLGRVGPTGDRGITREAI